MMSILLTLALAVTIENQTFRADDNPNARAVLHIQNERQVTIRNVVIDGRRDALHRPFPIAENGAPFIDYYPLNGIAIDRSQNVLIENVTLRNVTNLAIVVARSANVRILKVTVEDSGSLDHKGLNNTTGGILIEEGTVNFEVRDCRLIRVRGNGIWTHSYTVSPRNRDGVIANNEIDTAARDAIQVGHATNVKVFDNVMRNIGYPAEIVDAEPVGIDTAGDVDKSEYRANRMFEINGKCFDLDGFRDGELTRNLCINSKPVATYPHGNFGVVFNDSHPDSKAQNIIIRDNVFDGMKYGALFVIGPGHVIENNLFLNLNQSGSKDPLLSSSIAFADGVLRSNPPKVTVRGNLFTGKSRCPGPYPEVRYERNQCQTSIR